MQIFKTIIANNFNVTHFVKVEKIYYNIHNNKDWNNIV